LHADGVIAGFSSSFFPSASMLIARRLAFFLGRLVFGNHSICSFTCDQRIDAQPVLSYFVR
jgi:uncharacterized protein (DUF2062 family)